MVTFAYAQPKQHRPQNFLKLYWHYTRHLWHKKQRIVQYRQEVTQVRALIDEQQGLTTHELFSAIHQAQIAWRRNGQNTSARHQALALLALAAKSQLQLMPYDVQLLCVLAMVDGHMVQLAPGEGKTLTLGLVACLLAWHGKPCHVMTANDYLADRDALILQPLFDMAGVEVSCVNQQMTPEAKQQAYQAHVVYGTAKQFLADFLQDLMALGVEPNQAQLSLMALKRQKPQVFMRGLHTAIVDEADSILIDEATTPLIISFPEENPLLAQAVMQAKALVDQLVLELHYHLKEEGWEVEFTSTGFDFLAQHQQDFPRLWHQQERYEDLIKQAILARDKFKQDEHYVIQDDAVILVDESTGRLMPGRSWSYGLHQAVEARAGVPLTNPSKTRDKMSFQAFFQSFHHLTGASGTLQNIQEELFFSYGLPTLTIPSRLPSQLRVLPYQSYPTQEAKINALIAKIHHYHQQQIPLLVGTRRIADSEVLLQRLEQEGLRCEVLNAKQFDKEADIVAQAGQWHKITVATNMAGRGTDIAVPPDVLQQGGLRVLMLEPHDSSRIDWQLFGRAGRQGNPGEAIPFVSAEDPLLQHHLHWLWQPLKILIKRGWLSARWTTFLVKRAQQRAQNKAYKRRKMLFKMGKRAKERMSFIRSKD